MGRKESNQTKTKVQDRTNGNCPDITKIADWYVNRAFFCITIVKMHKISFAAWSVLLYYVRMFSTKILKLVSEYDQEIPQSQTVDKPIATRGRATQQSRYTMKTDSAKQPALSSLSI